MSPKESFVLLTVRFQEYEFGDPWSDGWTPLMTLATRIG